MHVKLEHGRRDGVISLLTSFGYFEDREDDLRVLKNVHLSLKPGGCLLVDTMSKEFLARSFGQRHWQETDKGRYWLVEREILPGWEKMHARWIFVGKGPQREFVLEHRIYSAAELVDLMRRAGFCKLGSYGDLGGRPYDREANRLVVVGRKPGSADPN